MLGCGLKGNPVKIRDYPRSCKFQNSNRRKQYLPKLLRKVRATFATVYSIMDGKALKPERVRRPACKYNS